MSNGTEVSSARRPTMHDVALAAGASVKTVSRVVNLEEGVSPEMRRRVLSAIDRLAYAPDVRARNLRQHAPQNRTIGMMLVDTANPIASVVSRSVEDVARAQQSLVITGSSDEDPQRERELFRELVSRRVDGFVMYPTDDAGNVIAPEIERGTAIVCVDRALPGLPCDTVVSDNRGGARALTEHLLAHGHRDIAFLSDELRIYTARERRAGFLDALTAADIKPRASRLIAGLRDAGAAEAATRKLLSDNDRPTAIVSGVNLITIGVVRALHSLGLQHTIALAAFDDVLFAPELDPAITVVRQNPHEIGRRAAELLFDRLAGDATPPALVTLPTPLVIRGSAEIRP